MGIDSDPQKLEVALDHLRHRVTVPLPQCGTPLDVGEEEGDDTGGEIRHGPFPYARLVLVRSDCRLVEVRSETERRLVR